VLLYAVSFGTARLSAKGGMVGYFLAGRGLPAGVVAVMLAGLAVGGASTVGVAQRAYTDGLGAGWYNAAWAFGALVMGLFAAARYRRMEVATLPEFFEQRYGVSGRILGVLGQLVIQIVITSLQYVAGGAILGDGRVVVILSLADLAKARPDETATRTYLSYSQMQKARRVLVADASLASRSLLKGLLENAGLIAHTAPDTASAKDFLARRGADLLLARADQPEIAVSELATALRSQPDKFETPLVLLVHNFDEKARIAGLHAGADAFVARDRGGPQAILDAVQRLLGQVKI